MPNSELFRWGVVLFERDYLVRMLVDLAAAIKRSMQLARGEKDLESATAALENSITNAVDLDGSVLLTLAPESIAQVLQISNTDPRVVIYIAHSMLLQSHYLRELNDENLASLREEQAKALAQAYHFELPDKLENLDDECFNEDEFIASIDEMCKVD